MAADLLGDIYQYLKLTKEVTKDNVAFRIVTAGSFGVFILSALLAGLTTWFGDPIVCKGKETNMLIEAQCWIHGTRPVATDDNDHCIDANVSFFLILSYFSILIFVLYFNFDFCPIFQF